MKEQEMKVCSNDKTPLIWTFAFNGAEFWCPYCGYVGEMFGAGENVKETPERLEQLKKYKKYSQRYLKAQSRRICKETKFKGKWIKPSELPEYIKERDLKVIKSYKYKVKL